MINIFAYFKKTNHVETIRGFFKTSMDVFFFMLMVMLILISSIIIFWQLVSQKVDSISKCKNTNKEYSSIYVVNAKDEVDRDLYKVSYDFKTKKSKVSCTCKPGNTLNKFSNIPIRDMKTFEDTVVDKQCYCKDLFDDNEKGSYFYGEPGIVRYIMTKDSTFFDQAYRK
jgi:hypothetical protein